MRAVRWSIWSESGRAVEFRRQAVGGTFLSPSHCSVQNDSHLCLKKGRNSTADLRCILCHALDMTLDAPKIISICRIPSTESHITSPGRRRADGSQRRTGGAGVHHHRGLLCRGDGSAMRRIPRKKGSQERRRNGNICDFMFNTTVLSGYSDTL